MSDASRRLPGAFAAVHDLAARAVDLARGGPLEREAVALRTRLEGPLRVAIAGRLKAGKSTLLNALVGERLAPTDAGEATTIVTFYEHGLSYDVEAVLRDGTRMSVPFRRDDRALRLELAALDSANVERLEVAWPASTLRKIVLIDTPGLASLTEANSVRTQEFLALGEGRSSEADAVIYLMRHAHRSDVDFLDAFLDRSIGNVSPVNAIAVLSRADEIGAARADAMVSAGRIAERYRRDPLLRTLCATVLPLAGLLAETGLTLREEEYRALSVVAALPADALRALVLSADRFSAAGEVAVSAEVRRALLERLGMYGVRLALDEIRSGRVSSAPQLAALLTRASGLDELRRVIEEHFVPRAATLKARSALAGVRGLARELWARDADAARQLELDAERVEVAAHEFSELRLAHLVMSGAVSLSEEEVEEVRRLMSGASAAERLGVADDSTPETVRRTAIAGIERWRSRAEDPLSDPLVGEAAQIAARSYESIFHASGRA